jgi:gas vesicle protein
LILSNIREEEFYMSNQSNSMGGFGVGLLVGAVLGAGVALLYAPNSGEKTRKLIKDRVEDAWDVGVDQMEDTRKQGKEILDKVQKQVNEVMDTTKKKLA